MPKISAASASKAVPIPPSPAAFPKSSEKSTSQATPAREPSTPTVDDLILRLKALEEELVEELKVVKSARELDTLVAMLDSRELADRLQAVAKLSQRTDARARVVRALCKALAVEESTTVRDRALLTLEKLAPKLHPPIATLLTSPDLSRHATAAEELGEMGRAASAATPILLAHVDRIHEKAGTSSYPARHVAALSANAFAMAKIAPKDANVQAALLRGAQLEITGRNRREFGSPARRAAVQALADALQAHPAETVHVLSGIIDNAEEVNDPAARTMLIQLLGRIAEAHPRLRGTVTEALMVQLDEGRLAAIEQLGKCGFEGKKAIPMLERFERHDSAKVRSKAEVSLTSIADAVVTAPIGHKGNASTVQASSLSETDSYGTAVDFARSPTHAMRQARRQRKMALILHVSGGFEDSCFT